MSSVHDVIDRMPKETMGALTKKRRLTKEQRAWLRLLRAAMTAK
jgi:hypothetical protein